MSADPTTRNAVGVGSPFAEPMDLALDTERGDVESYVTDGRSLLRPAQVVEGRVFEVLQRAPVLVSQFERPARPRYR